MLLAKLLGAVGAAVLVVVGCLWADHVWNDGRLFYLAMGRDGLVGLCTPPAQDALAGRGFTPTDFTIGDHPSIAMPSSWRGHSRVLSGPFTFSDGPEGQRVDGYLVCAVRGRTVQVDVRVTAQPLRAA